MIKSGFDWLAKLADCVKIPLFRLNLLNGFYSIYLPLLRGTDLYGKR
jgi:hypothetical protein